MKKFFIFLFVAFIFTFISCNAENDSTSTSENVSQPAQKTPAKTDSINLRYQRLVLYNIKFNENIFVCDGYMFDNLTGTHVKIGENEYGENEYVNFSYDLYKRPDLIEIFYDLDEEKAKGKEKFGFQIEWNPKLQLEGIEW